MDQNQLVQMLSSLGWEVECEHCGSVISSANDTTRKPSHTPSVQQKDDEISFSSKNIKKDKYAQKITSTENINSSQHQYNFRKTQNPLSSTEFSKNKKALQKKGNTNKKAKNQKKEIIWTRDMDSDLLYYAETTEKDWNLVSIKMQVDINKVLARYKKLSSTSDYQIKPSSDWYSPCDSTKRQSYLINEISSTKNSHVDNIFDTLSNSHDKIINQNIVCPLEISGFDMTPQKPDLINTEKDYFVNFTNTTPRKDIQFSRDSFENSAMKLNFSEQKFNYKR